MKRVMLLLTVAGFAAVSFSSCKKEEIEKAAITQTHTVQLKANESYTFVLPKNKRNDAYEFTTTASHASVSAIGKDASGNPIYQYTPEVGYVGTDQVVLSNDYEREEHANKPHPRPLLGIGHPKGDCKGGEEDHYIVTINFVVQSALESRGQ